MSERVEMTLQEQKMVMLEILSSFAEFCKKHELNYFLDAGTLIGAVRHQGFIPWDDDVDVCMPRADYNKFMSLMREQNDKIGEHIFLERPENIMYPFPKLGDDRTILVEHPDKKPEEVAVYIDIFPKDYIQDKNYKAKRLCRRSGNYELIQWFNHYSRYTWKKSKSPIKRFIAWLGRIFVKNPNWGVPRQQKLIERHNKKINPDTCKYVTTLVRGEFNKLAPKECFDSYIEMPFESRSFRVPVGYDTYLRCLYTGDYMQLPPEDKRINHNTLVYWKNQTLKDKFYNAR